MLFIRLVEMQLHVVLCFIAVVAVQGSLFIEFDLSTNEQQCNLASLVLIQSRLLSTSNGGSNETAKLLENPLNRRHRLDFAINDNPVITFFWERVNKTNIPNAVCCWSVSNVTLTDDISTINMTVDTCAKAESTAYNCSGATWFCTPPADSFNQDKSQLFSDSFEIMTDDDSENIIEIKVDSKCPENTQFSTSFPDELAACEEEEPFDSSTATTKLSPTTLAMSQQENATSSMFTVNQGTATSSMFTIDLSSSVAIPSSVFSVTSSIQAPVTTQLLSTPTNKPIPTFSVSLSQISILPSNVMPPVIVCERDGVWIETAIGTTITIQNACYGGTTAGTRRCMNNGEWADDVDCITSMDFTNTLNLIQTQPEEGLNAILTLLTSNNATVISSQQYLFLLQSVVQSLQEQDDYVAPEFIDVFLTTASELTNLIITNDANLGEEDQKSLGAQLLRTLDDFALTVVQPSNTTQHTIGSIVLTVLQFNEIPDDYVTAIQLGYNSISHPLEIFGDEITDPVRIASFLYRNLSSILPPRNNDTSIVSPIISSITNCEDCPIDYLDNNVTIQLQIQVMPSDNQTISCVFFKFENNGDSLTGGDWSTDGCTTIVDGDIVTCSCNHLTHFAILLSPGIEISQVNYDVLNVIGLVLVPISLLCMVAVILTYSLMRSLWSIRNYIHIMLCVSLFVAQLVFIIGIDKIKNEGACSAIAVILQYLFLVTFMWMLMEGVVLYVTLVRVFISNHRNYIIGFTMASYGIPAVYMIVVVPLGFLVGIDNIPGQTHYLYYVDDTLVACWLNYNTGFIASFIAPVCLIVLVNVGFFVMAIVIMRKHYKKQEKKKATENVKHWLKVSISLVLVMGVTWITGLLAFSEKLIFVVYLYTIFVASQGILLFIILVLLSQQVRQSYLKMIRRKLSESEKASKLFSFVTSSTSTTSHSDNKEKEAKGKNGVHRPGGITMGTFGDHETSLTDTITA